MARVLAGLDVGDTRKVYEAIRLAATRRSESGEEEDVSEEPTRTLRAVMELAADRDTVARQYATDFRDIFDEGVPTLRRGLVQSRSGSLEEAIIYAHLHWMATVRTA